MDFIFSNVIDVTADLPHNTGGSCADCQKWAKRDLEDIKLISVHHSGGPILPNKYNQFEYNQILSAKSIKTNYGSTEKPLFPYNLPYHFSIGRNGGVYQLNNLTDIVWNVKNADDISIGIVLHGNLKFQDPSKAQLESLEKLLLDLTNNKDLGLSCRDVYGHSELKGIKLCLKYFEWHDFGNYTTCPEFALPYVQEFRNTGNITYSHLSDDDIVASEIGEFIDIGGEYEHYIKAITDSGVMKGYQNKLWNPKNYITRGELAKVIVGASLKGEDIKNSYTRISK